MTAREDITSGVYRETLPCGCVYYHAGNGHVHETACDLHSEIVTLRGQRDHYKRAYEAVISKAEPR